MGKILRFFSFYVKISQYWLKFLGCPQNFGVVLKNVKMLLENRFLRNFLHLSLTETLATLPQSLHDIILSLYLQIHSFAQKPTLFA